MLDYLMDILHRFYYFLFDRLILYPLLSLLCGKLNIRFMNLGYQCKKNEDFQVLKKLSEMDNCCIANITLYEKALSLCPKYPDFGGLRLLEVGCGQGGGIEWILRAHSFATVNGTDLVIANSYSGKIVRGNAQKLPFDNDSFDIILNIESSHLYSNCQQFFLECSRVLSKNGFLCWADLRYTHQLKMTMIQAQRSGLHLITMEDVTEQVLQGIKLTAVRYDAMLQNAPYFIRLFQNSIRMTYCAPGTINYERFLKREKMYVCACWQNYKRITKVD
uniref:Methyltransf_11 domain-containing protein n=1 Tax=Elaeophora elaphi TaxID=1147741 RepID=A0A0R3RX17_9BILA